jgi:hypothetical protein
VVTRFLDWLFGYTTITRFALGCLLACAIGNMAIYVVADGVVALLLLVAALFAGMVITKAFR